MRVTSWAECHNVYRTTRKRRVANNTYLVKEGDSYGIRLHNTVVVTFHKDGGIELNNGGWKTHTTKQRINHFTPAWINVYCRDFVWFVRSHGEEIEFENGMILYPKHQEPVLKYKALIRGPWKALQESELTKDRDLVFVSENDSKAVTATVTATHREMVEWFCLPPNMPPYPSGTLLFYWQETSLLPQKGSEGGSK